MSTTAKNRYAAPKARNDAYTGLLAISLLAMLVSCVLLYLDYSQYGTQKPSMPRVERSLPPPTSMPPGGEPAGPTDSPTPQIPMPPAPPMPPMGGANPNPMGGPG